VKKKEVLLRSGPSRIGRKIFAYEWLVATPKFQIILWSWTILNEIVRVYRQVEIAESIESSAESGNVCTRHGIPHENDSFIYRSRNTRESPWNIDL